MMDEYKLYKLLGVRPLDLLITKIQTELLGQELVLECLYDSLEAQRPFQLIYRGCNRVELHIHQIVDAGTGTMIVGFTMGEEEHRKPAVLDTDSITLAIWYQDWVLRKNW